MGMCVLKLSKVLMYEFHYDTETTQNYYLQTQTV